MHSFIELPRLAFNGRVIPSLYVNTGDIIEFHEEWDGQVSVEVRQVGTEGMAATVRTYIPMLSFVASLGVLAEMPGVTTWTDEVKTAWAAPIILLLQEAAERERASAAR